MLTKGKFDLDEVMTVHDVSQYLKLAESTIYRLVRRGELPGRKVGGAWRFSRQEVEDWLRKRPLPSETSINQPKDNST